MPFNQVIAVECLTIVCIDKEIEQVLKEVEGKKSGNFCFKYFFHPFFVALFKRTYVSEHASESIFEVDGVE